MSFIDFISTLCFTAGGFFVLVGVLGNIRMPDFFSRTHAAGVQDSLGVGLIILGAVFYFNKTVVTIKLVILIAFMLFTGAIATHALAKAAYDSSGLKPSEKSDKIRKRKANLSEKITGKKKNA